MSRSQIRTARSHTAEAREQILQAAREEFAEFGFNGGRVDNIARRSGLNKQLVYYYFGSKDDLYRAALEAIYSEIRLRERELDMRSLAPEEAIARLIDFSLNYLAQHHEFIRILADENAMGAPHLQNAETMLATNSPLIAEIGATLRDGETRGIFRRGIDPLELYISIAGMTFFYFANGRTMSAIFGRDLSQPAVIESYRQHITALILGGLRA